MNYIDFEVGNKSYKLRLNTRAIVLLEKKLGYNPVKLFIDASGKERIPTVEEMVTVLYCALQPMQSEITLDSAFEIFDNWLEEGNIVTEFVAIVVEIYRESGLFKRNTEKN